MPGLENSPPRLLFGGLTKDDIPLLRIKAAAARAQDPLKSYADLTAAYQEGTHFRRIITPRNSRIAVVATHAGNLEPGTGEFARLLAGDEFSLYVFESLLPEADERLHITSARFNDPACLALVQSAETVVTIHGCRGDYDGVFVGGRNKQLRKLIVAELRESGVDSSRDFLLPGVDPNNICNRGTSGAGVQIEIAVGTRRDFLAAHRNPESESSSQGAKALQVLRRVLLELR